MIEYVQEVRRRNVVGRLEIDHICSIEPAFHHKIQSRSFMGVATYLIPRRCLNVEVRGMYDVDVEGLQSDPPLLHQIQS